jgi:dihydroorotate dehydrogenase
LFIVSASGVAVYGAVSFYKNDKIFYKNVVMPLVHLFDPESAHRLGIVVSKYRLIPKSRYIDPESLRVTVFGKQFKNPIGIAAGFDKHAEAVLGLSDLGFGFVEVGSVTPEPQPGNDKPRVFRLPEDHAVVNRYGFNSEGHDKVLERLSSVRRRQDCDAVIGVNLGKNKNSADPVNDYVMGVKKLGVVCDYLVINISSPNTPGLRSMQDKSVLRNLLTAVVDARNGLPDGCKPPLLVKLAPDLSYEELQDITQVVTEKQTRVDGLIISNTTVERPLSLLNNSSKSEAGGLSGKPLKNASTKMIGDVYRLTKGEIPIIGEGSSVVIIVQKGCFRCRGRIHGGRCL